MLECGSKVLDFVFTFCFVIELVLRALPEASEVAFEIDFMGSTSNLPAKSCEIN